MGGNQARLVAGIVFVLVGCAKGEFGGGSNTSFGIGMSTSSGSSGNDDGGSDRDDTDANDNDPSAGPSGEPTSDASGTGIETGDDGTASAGGELCGNGTIDAGEDCDGDELGGMDCATLGLAGGTLACSQCAYDTTGCATSICGDGLVGSGEECDCAGGACTSAGLQNQACTDLPAPSGGNYTGGTLDCDGACALVESGCWACGDGAINEGEECDGGSLGGATCQTLGHDDGSVSCSGSCAIDASACVDWVCGNGVCEPDEDSCNCADCPDDPNSCSPCQCGGFGGACFCDAVCVEYGDCCANGPC